MSDYADYRPIRLARSEGQRLGAMNTYLQKHPEGHWSAEIRQARRSLDESVFEARKASRDGLKYYLRYYPDGAFAAQARSRLNAFGQVHKRKAQERKRVTTVVQKRQSFEDEQRRTWVTRFFSYWIKIFLSIRNWGSPIDQVAHSNTAFSKAFGQDPRPECSPEQCIKRYTSRYAIPIPSGTRIERSIDIDIQLEIERGKLKGARIVLPKRGFSRWYELENGLVSFDDDASFRQKATDWAQEKIASAVREAKGAKKLVESRVQTPGHLKVFSDGALRVAVFENSDGDSAQDGVEIKPIR
jgi:hypothetical protein